MKHKPLEKHRWTAQQIKLIAAVWDNTDTTAIAEKIGVELSQVNAIVQKMRKAGFNLRRKRVNGYIQILLSDVLEELNSK